MKRYSTIKAAIEKRHARGKLATAKQIQSLVMDAGQMDEAYRYICRYGKIVSDKSRDQSEDSPTGYYKAGCYRDMIIVYDGVDYRISMYNGEVTSFGHGEGS